MEIRDARPADLAGITAIYNHAVAHTTAVWNETPLDLANRTAWFAERQGRGFPVLVAATVPGSDAGTDEDTDDGTDADRDGVLGYASYGDWRAWSGYRFTVEHSVYVRADQRGRGIGRALLVELVARARKAGLHVMVAGIEAGNLGSIRLHENLGFQQAGHLTQVGAKFGTWLDLTFLQLTLDERPAPN